MQRCHSNRPKGDAGAAAEILGLGNEERPLKFGSSFTNPKGTSFHTLKYDFKPASVDISKIASVDVETNQQVTVTVPHLDSSGTEHTIFKGSQRPYQKECVLIIDHQTGEMKLEKLSSNIQVKKTRKESIKMGAAAAAAPGGKPGPPGLPSLSDPMDRLTVPPMRKTQTSTSRVPTSGSSARQKLKPPPVASSRSGLIPHHSPLPPSPNYLSPGHHQSPPGISGSSIQMPAHQSSPNTAMQAASLPMIGIDDFSAPIDSRPKESSPGHLQEVTRPVGSLSDSSSDSSSNSDSSSDSDSDNEPSSNQPSTYVPNGQRVSPSLCRPDHLLKEDLQLSESGSDSD